MKLIEYPSVDRMMADVAVVLAEELRAFLASQDRATLAVPGGTTPAPIFDALAETPLEWDRVDIILTDERWVAGDHPRSNTRLLYEHLLTEEAARANYVSLYTGNQDAREGAREVAGEVDEVLPVSLLLLGMGEDMHTASLFPGADNLAMALEEKAPSVVAITGGGAAEPRVTLSAPVLKGALSRHIVITGQAKRTALERALEIDDPTLAPVSTVLSGAIVHWAK